MTILIGAIGAVSCLLVLALAASTIKIAKEYERGVVFRLGRLMTLRGPGIFFIIPFGIDHVTVGGEAVPVREQAVLATPLCTLEMWERIDPR